MTCHVRDQQNFAVLMQDRRGSCIVACCLRVDGASGLRRGFSAENGRMTLPSKRSEFKFKLRSKLFFWAFVHSLNPAWFAVSSGLDWSSRQRASRLLCSIGCMPQNSCGINAVRQRGRSSMSMSENTMSGFRVTISESPHD